MTKKKATVKAKETVKVKRPTKEELRAAEEAAKAKATEFCSELDEAVAAHILKHHELNGPARVELAKQWSDFEVLCRTLGREAGNQPMQGIIGVACCILNRVAADSWYGKDIKNVCLWPWQFSCWNAGDPNERWCWDASLKPEQFGGNAYAAAEHAVRGMVNDPTGGATHYYAEYLDHLGKAPAWAQTGTLTVQIGAHKFYTGVK